MIRAFLLMPAVLLLFACGAGDDEATDERRVPVTSVEARLATVQVTESTVGRLEARSAPRIAAETAGRIARVHHDAGDEVEAGTLLAELTGEVQQWSMISARAETVRLTALADNQERTLRRLESLRERQSVSQDQLDEAGSQFEALTAQLEEARARLSDAEYQLERTRIKAPASGTIQSRHISEGDYVSPGDPVFHMVAPDLLRALLPMPERLQEAFRPGQLVRMRIPARPDEVVEAQVSRVRPRVGEGSRSVDVIVDLENPGHWLAGGSVGAEVVLEERDGILVPAASVVRRPAGSVVYVIEDGRSRQQEVRTGVRVGGDVEIIEGLEGEESLVLDGAGFMTDGAAVEVQGEP